MHFPGRTFRSNTDQKKKMLMWSPGRWHWRETRVWVIPSIPSVNSTLPYCPRTTVLPSLMSKKVPQLQHSKPMTVDSYKTNCLSVTPIAGPGASSLPRSRHLQRAALQDLSRALQKELLLGTCGVFRIRVSCSLGWSRTHEPPDLSSRELGLPFPYRPFPTTHGLASSDSCWRQMESPERPAVAVLRERSG